MESPDWIQFQLDLPMIDSPGKRFMYNSGAVHLLSAMVRKTSGMSALSFARKHLFEPLGISDVIWPTDPRGEDNHGWGDLQLRPQDMAKIGYLFLQNGRWEGKPILSADWARSATQKRISLEDGEGYGYLWWMPAQPSGLVEARGRGGQRIIIWPEKSAVIVFTGGGFEPGRVGSYLVTALESDKPLAANPAGTSRLEKIIKRVAEPSAASKSDAVYWPETAKAISGKRYALEPNSRLIQALTLTYKNEKEAVLRLLPDPSASDTRQIEFLIGLDDVPRLAPGRFGLSVACKGAWKSPKKLVIEIDEVANINQFRLELTFENSRLDGKLAEMTGLGSIPIHGKLE